MPEIKCDSWYHIVRRAETDPENGLKKYRRMDRRR